jgi:hypothetical protein
MEKKKSERRYPPAYYKYKREHPTISVVLTAELKALINEMRGDLSYEQFIKHWIMTNIDELARKVADLKKDEFFSVPCHKCQKPVVIHPTQSPEVKDRLNKAFSHLGHDDCIAGYHPERAHLFSPAELQNLLDSYGITPTMVQRHDLAEAAKRLTQGPQRIQEMKK